MKKSLKLPAVLSLCLIMIFAQTAGAFFSGSLSLFAYAGLIIAVSFSILPLIANMHFTEDNSFSIAQFYSILFNSFFLLIIAAFIIFQAILNLSVTRQTDIVLTFYMALGGFIAMLCAAIILFTEEDLKALSKKFILTALSSFFIIIGIIIYNLKDIFLDSIISILFACLILLQAFLLIKKSIKIIRKK